MGTVRCENQVLSLGFSRAGGSAPDTARAAVLYGNNVPISGRADSRESVPYKEKTTLPGTPADVSEFVCVAALDPEGSISASGFGNINPIPFRSFGGGFLLFTHTPQFGTGFPYSLGPTDPCSTAVHMEPFSTSVLKVLTRVFATTTKICASGGSRRAYARHLRRSPLRPSYSPGLLRAAHKELRLCPGGRVWARRWSAIHFQG
jgi:hypothetical protein